jgi:flagellar biosynthesis protein FlhB
VSDEQDQENRTEPASGRRLAEARSEGQIPMGHDAVLAAGLIGSTAALVALAGTLRTGISDLLGQAAATVDRTPFSSMAALAARPAAAALAICAAAGLATAVATVAQTGGGFWGNLAAPDASRLFGAGRLTRMFQKDFALDILLALAKVAAVGAAAWSALRRELPRIPALLTADPGSQLEAAFRMLAAAARPTLAAVLVLAALEYFLARWRFAKKLRMTKEELKRDAKDEEGDPQIKGQRRRRHRERMRNQARIEVPRADALVVNPTHVAVAIRYRRDEGRAPRVTAKGKGELADHMRSLARENGVPIVQDVPLARLLYRKVKVGRQIPAQTYKAVAAVLAFVYRVTGRRDAGVRA